MNEEARQEWISNMELCLAVAKCASKGKALKASIGVMRLFAEYQHGRIDPYLDYDAKALSGDMPDHEKLRKLFKWSEHQFGYDFWRSIYKTLKES